MQSDIPRTSKRYRIIVLWALLGTLMNVAFTFSVITQSSREPLEVIFAPSINNPTTETFRQDFPNWTYPEDGNNQHDGSWFYVMARNPLDMNGEAAQLDRPQYRWQRPLHAWLAWAGHPNGGGYGLLWSFMAVTALGIFAGGIATGLLAQRWNAPAWTAIIYPLLPGALMSMRLAIADALAVTLVLWGAYFLFGHKQKLVWASIAFTLAMLAKESSLVPIIGLAIATVIPSRQTRQTPLLDHLNSSIRNNWKKGLLVLGTPVTVAALWWAFVKLSVPTGSAPSQIIEFVFPITGFIDSVKLWARIPQPIAYLSWLLAAIPTLALFIKTRFSHPFAWATYLSFAFAFFLSKTVIGVNMNASRILLAPTILAILALLSSQYVKAPEEELSQTPT